MITLSQKNWLGEGTARVVYRHPNDPNKCIKIVKTEKIQLKKKRRGFRGLFLPLSHFDPTKSELKIFKRLLFKIGYESFEYIPMFYGAIETSEGSGGVFDLVGDQNLQAHLAENPFDEKIERKLYIIRDFFIKKRIHFSDWRASNFVVKWHTDKSDYSIFAIDGFEYTEFIPITRIPYFSKMKITRRSEKMILKLKRRYSVSRT